MRGGSNFDRPKHPSSAKYICVKEINPNCACLKCRAERGLTEADNDRLEQAAAEMLAAHPAEAPRFKMNSDPGWLMEKVAQDDGEITSAGGLIVELEGK